MKGPKSFVCIECGQPINELYQRYHGDIIKVLHCDSCGSVADKYIEYDAVLILLDALLHKPQAYRHVLLNTPINWEWKLLMILLLCSTYEKWESPQSIGVDGDTGSKLLHAALEWHFYKLFFISLIEWFILCSSVVLLLNLYQRLIKDQQLPTSHISRGIILSSFGRLLIIAAILWGQTHSATYLLLSELFVFTSNVAAIKVLCRMSRGAACFVVFLSHTAQWTFRVLMVDLYP